MGGITPTVRGAIPPGGIRITRAAGTIIPITTRTPIIMGTGLTACTGTATGTGITDMAAIMGAAATTGAAVITEAATMAVSIKGAAAGSEAADSEGNFHTGT